MVMRTVILQDLSAENKRRAWEWLKEHNAPLANLIKDDPHYKQLIKTFNAKTEVEIDDSVLLRPGQA